ncbi:MAG: hypothetical protein KAJ23_07140 [Maribacter sp.]|nr:hypothetical protein [Maribacter sp.]
MDRPVGMGMDQALFKSGPNTGVADKNISVRRDTEIQDVQFGNGAISSPERVAGYG